MYYGIPIKAILDLIYQNISGRTLFLDKTYTMTDNKNKQDGRDDSKIDSKDSSEVAYAAREFKVTPDEIRKAISKVGNSRAKVKEYLSGK